MSLLRPLYARPQTRRNRYGQGIDGPAL